MKEALGSVRGKWTALESGTRLMLIVGLLGLAIAGYVIYERANFVEWAVLYSNVDDATASDVLAGLDAHGIPYKVEGNGTRILVPADELATTKVVLAGDGVTAQPVPEGFDEIFAQQGLASSDFEQRVNYQRALEGELARTLLAMEPVAGARVQLSIPEPTLFVGSGEAPADGPTASVMLQLNRDLTRDESDTIANIVASAVPGLSADQVTIASADGTLLRSPGGSTSTGDSSEGNLQLATDYETALSQRLTSLARTLTGTTTATVEVRAAFDFTQSTIEKDVIDPTKNTPTAEREMTESWTGSGSQAGGASGVDGGPTSSGSSDGTYEKSDKTTTFVPGDRTITKSTITTPSVTRLNVAVVVPVGAAAAGGSNPALDEQTLSRVIGSAAGIDEARGDTIEVAVVPATVTDGGSLITDPATPTGTESPANADQLPIDLLLAAAGAGAFVMLLLSLFGRRRRRRSAAAIGATGGRRRGRKGQPEVPATEVMPRVDELPPMDPDRQAVEEIKHDLERMVAESPESLAALLSTWMAK